MIVFFDGVCGLCNHFVSFAVKRDHARVLRFAPLQGQTSSRVVSEEVRTGLDTLVFLQGTSTHYRSGAVARILMQLGGIWRILGTAMWLIPSPLRDLGYRIVARFRYRLFGKHEACRLPSPEERAQFLD